MNSTGPASVSPEESALAIASAKRILETQNTDGALSNHQLACLKLKEHRFCPPGVQKSAVQAMTAPASALNDLRFAEQVYADLLQGFCRDFFKTGLDQRKKRWAILHDRLTPFPALIMRFSSLKPGLGAKLPQSDEGDPSLVLAREICNTFVMHPQQAAAVIRRRHLDLTESHESVQAGKTLWEQLLVKCSGVAGLRPLGVRPLALRIQQSVAQQFSNPQKAAHVPRSVMTPVKKRVVLYLGSCALVLLAFFLVLFSLLRPFLTDRQSDPSKLDPPNTEGDASWSTTKDVRELMK
jgi:hypothetical protein